MTSKHAKFVFGTLVVLSSAATFIFTPTWLVRVRGGGKILIFIAMLPLIIAYSLCLLLVLRKKHRESLILAKALAKNDPAWDLQSIYQHIENVFALLQKATQEKNVSILQPYVSERITDNLNKLFKLEQTATQYQVYEGVVLGKCTVVSINDYREDCKDSLWATVTYRMKTYTVAKKTKRTVGIKPLLKQEYNELWKLTYNPGNGWILEERHESIKLSQLLPLQSFSESYPKQPDVPVYLEIGKAVADYEWMLHGTKGSLEVPPINSPIVALMLGLLAPWIIVLIFFLRIFYNSG